MTFLCLTALLAGCGSSTSPYVEPDAGAGDGGPDAPLSCGDERGPIDIPPEPVVNGTESFDPSVVALTDGQSLAVGALLQQVEPPTWENVCTGTLIGPDLVLTAAHCLIDIWTEVPLGPAEVRFAVGVDAADPMAVYDVSVVAPHPDFDLWAMEATYDVGILVLSEPAAAALPWIEPIPVNCEALLPSEIVGQLVQNVGYGMTDPDDWWELNTRRWWTVEEVVALTYYDFTVDGRGVTGVCYGDSGGPSLWTSPSDGVVRTIGVVSWGEDESCTGRDHFALASYHCDFVDDYRDGCGDVTEAGRCEGAVAVYCDGGALSRVDCAASGRRCGDDGTGRMRCIAPADPCLGETVEGRCEGNTAIWCEDETLLRVDCDAGGLSCGPDLGGRYRCLADPCGGLGFAGRCEEDIALWCERGALVRVDCASAGLRCRPTGEGYYRCLADPCDELGWQGRCVGDTAIWCEDGEVRMRTCDACLQRCGWSDPFGGYYCL